MGIWSYRVSKDNSIVYGLEILNNSLSLAIGSPTGKIGLLPKTSMGG